MLEKKKIILILMNFIKMSELIDYMNYSQSEIDKIKNLYKIKGITLTYPRIFIEADEKEPPKHHYGFYAW